MHAPSLKPFRILAGALVLAPALAYAQTTPPAATGTPSPAATQPGAAKSDAAKPAAAKSTIARADRDFVEKAAMGGMFEVQLGQVAADKASDPDVKAFGERMVKDHGAANQELAQIAQSKGVTLPQKLDRKHQSTLDRLSKASGDSFDSQYMKEMVSDHKKDVNEFEKASKNVKDPDVKAFAEKTLPTLREHLKLAQSTGAKAAEKSAASGESGKSAGTGSRSGATGTGASPGASGTGSSSGASGTGGSSGTTR